MESRKRAKKTSLNLHKSPKYALARYFYTFWLKRHANFNIASNVDAQRNTAITAVINEMPKKQVTKRTKKRMKFHRWHAIQYIIW